MDDKLEEYLKKADEEWANMDGVVDPSEFEEDDEELDRLFESSLKDAKKFAKPIKKEETQLLEQCASVDMLSFLRDKMKVKTLEERAEEGNCYFTDDTEKKESEQEEDSEG